MNYLYLFADTNNFISVEPPAFASFFMTLTFPSPPEHIHAYACRVQRQREMDIICVLSVLPRTKETMRP